jgi:hypothetical protein
MTVALTTVWGSRAHAGPITAITIEGSYHTTEIERGAVPANDYNNKNTKVVVRYNIVVKMNPTTGKKEWDLANSTATFENEFPTAAGTPFVTDPIPITDIKGDPEAGEVVSFTVHSDKKWDPDRPEESNGLSGTVDVTRKRATLRSSYTSGGADPTITSYTFATNDKKPGKPKKDPRTGQPFALKTRISENDSIDYDAITGTLSVQNDTVIHTPFANDPLLGAAVTFPAFQFTGFTTDEQLAIFWPVDDSLFTMMQGGDVYVQASVNALFYLAADNVFFTALGDLTLAGMSPSSPFYNPDLPNLSSPFLTSLDSLLNPLSSVFAPLADFYLTITPDLNLVTFTDSFTKSGSTGADDLHFVADRPVPEPSTWLLLATGGLGLLACRRRYPQRAGPASVTTVKTQDYFG